MHNGQIRKKEHISDGKTKTQRKKIADGSWQKEGHI